MRKVISIILFFLLLSFAPIYGQTVVTTNSANVHDPRLLLINPAGMAFHDQGLFVSGYKLYYVCLGGDRIGNFYSGLSYRLFKPGIMGITGQLFHSDIFRQTQFDINYAISLWDNKLAVGSSVGLLGVSYNTEKFQLIDVSDPVLFNNPSKYKANLGAGILINPISHFYLGFSANHLNRPDLSLTNSRNRKGFSTNLSASYLHKIIRPFVSLELEDNETYVNFGLESCLLQNRVFLRGSYCSERTTFGAGYDFGRLLLNYEYDYYLSDLQAVSNGSHHLTFSLKFEKPKKPEFEIKITPLDSIICIKNGICSNQRAFYLITIVPKGGLSLPVTLSLGNPPEGLSINFSLSQITPAQVCTLTVTASCKCFAGIHTLVAKGEAAKIVRCDSTLLRIRMPRLLPKIICQPDEVTIAEKRRIFEESPLLNYIFFEEDRDSIPKDRYEIIDPMKTALPDLEFFINLPSVPEQYRNVLNHFGRRLKDNPNFKISLIGYNDGIGKEDSTLSHKRAVSVRDYFVKIWGISEDRINVEGHDLPRYPSPLSDPRGLEENRRVEILPEKGSEEILAAFTSTIVETEISNSSCVFFTDGTIVEAGLKNWQFSVQGHDGRMLYTPQGDTTLQNSIEWDLCDVAQSNPSFRDSLVYSLSITDNCGQDSVATGEPILVHYVHQDTIAEPHIMRSRLIFFAFDDYRVDLSSPRLQVELEKIIAKFRKHRNAEVKVNGYTDIMGDSSYNVRLSKRRAEEIKKELVRRGIPARQISADGFGPNNPLMTNELPEGRMINRRVEVDVIFPR